VIVVDTNVLSALAGRRDEHHAGCTGWLRGNDEVLPVPPTAVAGACYLTGRYPGPAAESAFPDSAGTGDNNAFPAGWIGRLRPRRTAKLVRRYAGRHTGGTGAAVTAVCERPAIVTVSTVNPRDFTHVRPRHMAALAAVPAGFVEHDGLMVIDEVQLAP
jgi:uncharacterized protein